MFSSMLKCAAKLLLRCTAKVCSQSVVNCTVTLHSVLQYTSQTQQIRVYHCRGLGGPTSRFPFPGEKYSSVMAQNATIVWTENKLKQFFKHIFCSCNLVFRGALRTSEISKFNVFPISFVNFQIDYSLISGQNWM